MIFVFIQKIRLVKAMDRDDKEKVHKITKTVMERIARKLSLISGQYLGSMFFGVLLAVATMWVQALHQIADEQDERICDTMLKRTTFKVGEQEL